MYSKKIIFFLSLFYFYSFLCVKPLQALQCLLHYSHAKKEYKLAFCAESSRKG